MARRFNSRYFVRLSRELDFKLSAAEFHELRAGGWIEPDVPGSKYADLARGVVAWVRGGNLHLLFLERIRSCAAGWWRAWLLKVGALSASHVGETITERRERLMWEQERERQNEALLWRTFRNTKGANSFSWMAPDTKAEILRALRPEAA